MHPPLTRPIEFFSELRLRQLEKDMPTSFSYDPQVVAKLTGGKLAKCRADVAVCPSPCLGVCRTNVVMWRVSSSVDWHLHVLILSLVKFGLIKCSCVHLKPFSLSKRKSTCTSSHPRTPSPPHAHSHQHKSLHHQHTMTVATNSTFRALMRRAHNVGSSLPSV